MFCLKYTVFISNGSPRQEDPKVHRVTSVLEPDTLTDEIHDKPK